MNHPRTRQPKRARTAEVRDQRVPRNTGKHSKHRSCQYRRVPGGHGYRPPKETVSWGESDEYRVARVCVFLFYVIDLVQQGPGTVTDWGLPVYPLPQLTLAMLTYPLPYWVPQSASGFSGVLVVLVCVCWLFIFKGVCVCVGCLFLRTPSRAPYSTPSACATGRPTRTPPP
jgi:hypothetical protein